MKKSVKGFIKKIKFKSFFNKLLKVLKNIISFIVNNKNIIYMSFPLILMDLSTRYLCNDIGFYKIYRLVPNLFTLCWVSFFISICLLFNKKVSKWVYLGINIIFVILYLIYNIYYSVMSNIFSFNLLSSVSEGSSYFIDALRTTNVQVYIFLFSIIILVIIGFLNVPLKKKIDIRIFSYVLLIFIFVHTVIPVFLGKINTELVWSTWKNPRNIYSSFNDSNKSLRVSGFYEYTFRGIYVTYFKNEKENEDELLYLDEVYSLGNTENGNNYTGIFEGKNLILLQLEGIDSWLLNKTDMPTLYSMKSNAINFNKHYSFYNGGGSTFNSEFAVNTGFTVPITYNKNAYSFNQNGFPYSMARLFQEKNYLVNAFHMNTKEYYSRGINYMNWGYNNYYSLLDMFDYKDNAYKLDRELINNTVYSDLMFPNDSLFVDYIITYSNHFPFTNEKEVCKMLYDEDTNVLEGDTITESSTEFVLMTEEECARRQAKETDYMISLLLNKLKEKKIYDNTVIIVFTDHYLYTLEDQTILVKYKETTNNLINNTPLLIWSSEAKKANFNKVTSQLNILPTVLNLFGVKYDTSNYIMADVFSKNYSDLVFFSDYSWYDGKVYVEGGDVTNDESISDESLEEKNLLVNELIKKNDLTLKYDYFNKK